MELKTEMISEPFYMPRLAAESLTPVDPNQTTVVTNPTLGVTLTVPPGTAINEADGTPFTGQISISLVPRDLAPANLPEFMDPDLLITIQPVGVSYTTPVPITFPNTTNLAPGSEVDLWSVGPDWGQFVVVGTGKVSADGLTIATIAGGIRANDWHATLRKPTLMTEPGKTTALTYDSAGRLLTRTETDTATGQTRITTMTYNAQGLVATLDGPRTDVTDVTTFAYDAQGNLTVTTNALNQAASITSVDAHGRPLTLVDANGATTTLTYDPLGRLLTRTVASATTTFTYDQVGQLTKTTLPDGSYLTNTYGAARRLTAVTDNLGNKIEYTYDLAGNRTQEQVKDPGGVLKRTLSRTYNALSQLTQTVAGAGQTTTFTYDANGNPTSTTVDPAGLNQATTQAFDALNRLTTTTDALNGLTTYTYDARNNLTSVTDPKGLTTTYTYDGLNRVTQQQSPDTGTTTYAYDAAGNRTSTTDARAVTSTFTYDVVNRLTQVSYPDATLNVSYTYDTCTNGVGRLCQMQEASGTTSYAYTAHGNLTSETITQGSVIKTLSYAYDNADRLGQVTYPSGRTVDYTRNALGQVASVVTTQNTVTTPLANNTLTYLPFGPLNGFTYGNGLTHARSYDQDYRLTALTTGAVQSLTYTQNAANDITAMTNTLDATRNQSFTYDALNRLTGATGIYGTEAYTYDANGNRLTSTINSFPETYTYATASHHLLETVNGGTRNYSYDGNGNTTDNGNRQFTYGDHNRLKEAQVAGSPVATYTYNGKGERVKKIGTDTTLFFYDQGGQLIAETDATGNTLREYLYVDGQPLAYVTGGNVNFIHTDHLGTPQLLTDTNQQVVWSADYKPFGEATITTETITSNLRFPGQLFDQETGLHYNYFRDYDPSTGRYVESDPIGLDGGINTYAYVSANPVKWIDPEGLAKIKLPSPDQLLEIKECICNGLKDCHACCVMVFPFRPTLSTIGICESMCWGEILKGHDEPLKPPKCDDVACIINNEDQPDV